MQKLIKTPAIIYEPGSSKRSKRSGWRHQKPVIDYSLCTSCLICWIYCPEPAVVRTPEDHVIINYDYCKGCGICAVECPRKAIKMVNET